MSVFWLFLAVILAIFPLLYLFVTLKNQRRRAAAARLSVSPSATTKSVDVLLVGSGAMSTTLGMMLHQLDPNLRICMVEQLDQVAQESTDALNNAGTGHAGYCELNYTPERKDGSIDVSKAFVVNTSFEVSLQFWSYLVEQNLLPEPSEFIHQVPHLSLVWGENDVDFLRKRHAALKNSVAFGDMEYSEDHEVLKQWMPLIMEQRPADEVVAATRVRYGADVNFGALARHMTQHLLAQDNFELQLHRSVIHLYHQDNKRWMVEVLNRETGLREWINAGFVFLGAGGGALPLLQKSGIPEGHGYGGFPVSGQWLICKRPALIERHRAKVYGKAALGAPPMSMPHLDTRMIDGERYLLFGPFAGFTTRFLKHGSIWDLLRSLSLKNLKPMLAVGWHNMALTRYLIGEVLQSHKARCESLRRFVLDARDEDWELEQAGKRVQIIKKNSEKGGTLEFGTEVVAASDGTLAALLGASPGASTSVQIMLNVLERCFGERVKSDEWQTKLKQMIPSFGEELAENDELFRQVRQRTLSVLKLDEMGESQ